MKTANIKHENKDMGEDLTLAAFQTPNGWFVNVTAQNDTNPYGVSVTAVPLEVFISLIDNVVKA